MAAPSSELTGFLRGLRAVRDYTQQPVADDVLADILDVGRWSGSASNRQPTEVIVVRDAALRQKLSECGAAGAAVAPVAIVITTAGVTERHDLEVFDEGRLVERLLLAARAQGLGGNVATLKGDGPATMKEVLKIPAERRVWTVVGIGHTDVEARRARPRNTDPARKPSDSFVHWERY